VAVRCFGTVVEDAPKGCLPLKWEAIPLLVCGIYVLEVLRPPGLFLLDFSLIFWIFSLARARGYYYEIFFSEKLKFYTDFPRPPFPTGLTVALPRKTCEFFLLPFATRFPLELTADLFH